MLFSSTILGNSGWNRSRIIKFSILVLSVLIVLSGCVDDAAVISYLDSTPTIESLTGSLVLSSHGGSCQVDTVGGDAELTIALPSNGFCRVTSGAGNITLVIPASTSATLNASSNSGSVNCSGLIIGNLIQLTGQISGTLATGEGEIDLKTNSGDNAIEGL